MTNKAPTSRRPRTALITGASSGFGVEFARLFAADGYDLVLVARGEGKLNELAEELRAKHRITVRVLPQDLAAPEAAQAVVAALTADSVTVDALVNNAGFATAGPFAEIDAAADLDLVKVNVLALTALTKLLLPGMLARHRGQILNVASTAAFQPGPLMAAYYASKAYVLFLSEAIAEEVRGSGVTVTCLCPGASNTGFAQRAGMTNSRLFTVRRLPDAATVARAGYAGLRAGKRVVIPGRLNAIMAQAARISPPALVTRIILRMHERV